MLQSELNGAKMQWEFLECAMCVFSVVSVGFAGGLVGRVIAPLVRSAQRNVANAAFRQGAQGIATRSTRQAVLRVVPEKAF